MTHLELLQALIERGYKNGKLLKVVTDLRSASEMLNFEAQNALVRNGLELDRIAVFQTVFPEHTATENTLCGKCWIEKMQSARDLFLHGRIPREIDFLLDKALWPPPLPKPLAA